MAKKKLSVEKKYMLYEIAVQSPDDLIDKFECMYKNENKRPARLLREDFCGTFQLSCAWAQRHPDNRVIALDLDPEPVEFGKKHNLSKLTEAEQENIELRLDDVRIPSTPHADISIACNFSFFIFKDREKLTEYFKAVYESLAEDGILILETIGGPNFINAPFTEERKCSLKNGLIKKKFTYYWEHRYFNPITHDGTYAIHFKYKDKKYEDVFVYDWRIWSIPEIKECMLDAGFKDCLIYWDETDEDGDFTGTFSVVDEAINDDTWISYAVGIKK